MNRKASLSLRIGSFNIKNGSGVKHKMSILAEDIKRHSLDVVGLQEVDIMSDRSGKIDTLKELADSAGYPYYRFTHTINIKGGMYGTAIMSRYPIVCADTVKLPTLEKHESRALGHAVIDFDGARVDFLNTHLSYEKNGLRAEQFKLINEYVKGLELFILTGDFNTSDPDEYSMIENVIRVNGGKYATFPSSSEAIDEIITCSRLACVASGSDHCEEHSDHDLLWAELQYTDGIKC